MATREDTLAELSTLFATLGLPQSLVSWAWDEIVLGKSDTEIMLEIEQRPEFKARFPGIDMARANGNVPPSPAEYVAYEQAASEAARRYGLPDSFFQHGNADYDARIAAAISNGVSSRQYVERLDDGFARVARAPQEVKDGFTRLFGTQGDAALATVYLDPTKAQVELEKMARAAEAEGIGQRFGLTLDKTQAMTLADYNLSTDQLRQGYGTLADQAQLFEERLTEQVDLAPEQQGVEAVFNLNEESRRRLQQRQAERNALTAGAGAAATDQKGASGLGAAR